MEFATLNRELESASKVMSQQKLEDLKATINKHYARRFKGKLKKPRYGSVSMVFREEELKAFFTCVQSQKMRLIFELQAYMGLRIGEAVRIRLDDINFETRELTIDSEKTRVKDTLIIPRGLFRKLGVFVQLHQTEILAAQGYIFYKDNDNNKNCRLHIDKNYARRVFKDARAEAGLTYVYGISEESCNNHRPRRLYRLGTHSLRRYAITRFHHVSKDIVMTSRYARHLDTKETAKYIENNRVQLYANIDVAFKTDLMQRRLMVATST
jgi:integrase